MPTVFANDVHQIERFGSVLVSINYEPPNVAGVRRVAEAVRDMAEGYPKGITLILVPTADRPALDIETSREIARAWREIGPSIRCAGIWIRRQGFVAATVRSMITGVMLLMPGNTTPTKAAGSLEEVATFAALHAQPRIGPDDLKRVVSTLVRTEAVA